MKKPKLQKKPRFRSKVSRAIYAFASDLYSSGMLQEDVFLEITQGCIKPDVPRIKRMKGGARVNK